MGSRSTSTAVRKKVRGFAEGSSLKPWRARRCAASSSVRPGHRSSVGSSVLGGVALSRNSERVTIIGCVSLEPGKAPGWWSDERWKTTNAHRASPLLISFEGAPGGSDCGHTASRMVLEIYDADGRGAGVAWPAPKRVAVGHAPQLKGFPKSGSGTVCADTA